MVVLESQPHSSCVSTTPSHSRAYGVRHMSEVSLSTNNTSSAGSKVNKERSTPKNEEHTEAPLHSPFRIFPYIIRYCPFVTLQASLELPLTQVFLTCAILLVGEIPATASDNRLDVRQSQGIPSWTTTNARRRCEQPADGRLSDFLLHFPK